METTKGFFSSPWFRLLKIFYLGLSLLLVLSSLKLFDNEYRYQAITLKSPAQEGCVLSEKDIPNEIKENESFIFESFNQPSITNKISLYRSWFEEKCPKEFSKFVSEISSKDGPITECSIFGTNCSGYWSIREHTQEKMVINQYILFYDISFLVGFSILLILLGLSLKIILVYILTGNLFLEKNK
ncbi:hypothetical protein HYV70_02410 [Candidatus Uhrbacteria bacterium]|nr:hypothetical protein [Candidatus Uhrbacteria bacterium]